MSVMKNVKMLVDYKFADLPQFGGKIHDAKKDEVVNVSLQRADELIKSKKAEDVEPDAEAETNKDESTGDGKKDSKIPSFLRKETK